MPSTKAALPPEVTRFSGLYRFIGPERFAEMGIDPEDVPLGTFPAQDHPPFLPDRFGGNAYGLGLFEQSVLPAGEAGVLDQVDLSNPEQVARHYRRLNDVMKRLGLLIRYSQKGLPFFLIPRQFVANFLVDIQARADEIVAFLSQALARLPRETMRVALVARESGLLLPEVQTRMPHLDFTVMNSLGPLTGRRSGFTALVMVDDPVEFALSQRPSKGGGRPRTSQEREDYGHFMAGRLFGLLEEGGELMVLADRPLGGTRDTVRVRFSGQGDFKRFLMFSHVYKTRRRYQSSEGLAMEVNLFDFNTFLSGLGVYHETVEGMLDGRSLAQVEPAEIDGLAYQDLPLPRGSASRMLSAWRRWFQPEFDIERLETILPEVQRKEWAGHYQISGKFPDTLVRLNGRRRRPPVSLARVQSQVERRHLAGCDRGLLADYKDSFTYVAKVMAVLRKARDAELKDIPGLELSRLRKPFESAVRHSQLSDVLELMELAPKLESLERRLNPEGIMGPRTPVLGNLERLSLMGVEEGPLRQLYLIVLGHSTMTRVTFGKLPETTLKPLTDLIHYRSLDEAVAVIRLYRLLSVAEAAAASATGLSPEQVAELFSLYDEAIRVVTDPTLDWNRVVDLQVGRLGGVQAMAARKMLKLFDLFSYLDSWPELVEAGPRARQAMADYDPVHLRRIEQVVELIRQLRRFVGLFYRSGSSSRPYFFRALLNCELHGTGRLLPRLGTAAGFTLLWICVHTSERRLLNFNHLLEVEREDDLPARVDKLRGALLGLEPESLSPTVLASLRETMIEKGEAWVAESGLHLKVDPATGALTPGFLDAEEELYSLKWELSQTLSQPLGQVPDQRLHAMDRRLYEVGRFLEAQQRPDQRLRTMARQQSRLGGQLENYLLRQLFDLSSFAGSLRRLIHNCPHLMNGVLPQRVSSGRTDRRLAAAAKLSALYQRRLDGFQDMQKSHETARVEFGPTAAGIVGVSPLQFQTLTGSLGQLLDNQPQLARLLMAAVLLVDPEGLPDERAHLAAAPLLRAAGLGKAQHRDLRFLLDNHFRIWQVVSGVDALSGILPLVAEADPPLLESLFLLAVITTAARHEGLMSEDLLERFFGVLSLIRRLVQSGRPLEQALDDELLEHARRYLAFEHYRDIQRGEAPTASLRHLLDTVRLPEGQRDRLLKRGRRQAGLERLLKLRGLLNVGWLDLFLLHHQVPVIYVYRLKALRSVGVTHFERDLYEGLRLYRALFQIEDEHRHYLLRALADPARPLRFLGFDLAAERLTYNNQIRLLLLGVSAARNLELEPGCRNLSFLHLAEVIARKYEMVNEAISAFKPESLMQGRTLRRLLKTREGLNLHYHPETRTLSLDIADPKRLDRKIEAVRRANTPVKLKRLYHEELKRRKLTTYHTLDYQLRLEAAFEENLERQGERMVERVRGEMAAVDDLARLQDMFQEAWEQGLELPLSRDRQQSLRDTFEMNLERIRALLLGQVERALAEAQSPAEVDALWERHKARLRAWREHLGRDFDLALAARFDQRAKELGTTGG